MAGHGGAGGKPVRASGGEGRRGRAVDPEREREFERLYRESYGLVYNYVRMRMGGADDAEDVVAEAYLKAARSFGAFDPARAKFSTWVVRIAANCMNDRWRRAREDAHCCRMSGDGSE